MRLAALAVLRMSLAIDKVARARCGHADCEPGLALAATENALLEHDLFRKPLHTFRDHALVSRGIDALRFEEFMPWPTCG